MRIQGITLIAILSFCASAVAAAQEGFPPLALKAIDVQALSELPALEKEAKGASTTDRDLALGIAYHNAAMADPKGYVNKSILSLEAADRSLGGAGPSGSLCRAYLGSAHTVLAGLLSSENDLTGAVAELQRGFDLIDGAVESMPGSATLRFIRMENGMEVTLSSPFDRSEAIEEDIAFLKAAGNEKSGLGAARVLLVQARLAIHRGGLREGIGLLEASAKAAPGTTTSAAARKLLARYAE